MSDGRKKEYFWGSRQCIGNAIGKGRVRRGARFAPGWRVDEYLYVVAGIDAHDSQYV